MNLIKEKFLNFLLPQLHIVEVFISSFFVAAALIIYGFNFIDEIDAGIIAYLLILFSAIFYFIITVMIIFKKIFHKISSVKKEKDKNIIIYLSDNTIQVAGIFFDIFISIIFIVGIFLNFNFSNIRIIDYFFLFYAAKVILRFLILYFFYGEALDKHMPKVKYSKQNSVFALLVFSIGLLVFIGNINNLYLATGYAYFSCLFFLDIYFLLRKSF